MNSAFVFWERDQVNRSSLFANNLTWKTLNNMSLCLPPKFRALQYHIPNHETMNEDDILSNLNVVGLYFLLDKKVA